MSTAAFAQTPFHLSAKAESQAIAREARGAAFLPVHDFAEKALEFYCKTLHLPQAPKSTIASPPKAWLGVSLEPMAAERLPLAGSEDLFYARVARVLKGSPGYLAGLKKGDIILKFNDVKIAFPEASLLDEFAGLLDDARAGERATLEVFRDGRVEALEVQLSPRPKLNLRGKEHPEIVCPGQMEASMLQSELERQKLTENFTAVSRYLEDGAEFLHYIDSGIDAGASPGRLSEVTFLLKNPFQTLPALAAMGEKLAGGPASDKLDLDRFFAAAFDYLDYPLRPPGETRSYATGEPSAPTNIGPLTLDGFVNRIVAAGELFKEAFSSLSPSELISLRVHLAKLLGDDFPAKGHEVLSPEEFSHFASLSGKINFNAIAYAAKIVFTALTRDKIDTLIKSVGAVEPANRARGDGLILYGDSPAGKIIVGGSGRNIYTEDAALIIDLGGDDLYLNNAGASVDGVPVSIVIDVAGDDTYIGAGAAGQGAGLMGIGVIIDLGGNDSYAHINSGQGLGAFGVGALVDLGGNDYYRAGRFAQGSGFFGAGLLYDSTGDDAYMVDAMGQGVGGPRGLGALIDSSGADRYISGSKYRDFRDPAASFDSMAQGFGFGLRPKDEFLDLAGGLGILLDAQGDDIYVGDYFAQGSAYWYSVGVLLDLAGDDSYIAGRYAQGAGAHFAAGALLDHSGSDSYFASFGVSQGVGHDRAFGLLYDGAGDDGYFGGRMSQGLGSANGLGIIVDAKGNDFYSASSPGQGQGLKYQKRGSFGLLLDIGPEDDMFSGSASASPSIERGGYGLFYDESKSRR